MKKSDSYYASRRTYVVTLCYKWICNFRPDVLEAIMKEVDKKYPLDGRNGTSIELPRSLEKLK